MYKKKEIMYLTIIAILFIIGILIIKKDGKHSSSEVISKNKIIINIDGEIARKTTIEYQEKTTYGTVFINVKNLLNEYSDLSKFNFYESIDKSMVINIPTLDINNNYNSSSFININTATKKELMTLPQIGEKRSEAIINYIKKNGKIKTWTEFFRIVSIKDDYKEVIKRQAIL
jgi:competence protein ComEA